MVLSVKVGWNYEAKNSSTDKTITIAIVIALIISMVSLVEKYEGKIFNDRR
tara:strand:+ start:791 stop:943 length:153 start_codon:yes stop_codon:yes gene_type:complete